MPEPTNSPESLVYEKCVGNPNAYDFDNITPTYSFEDQTQETVCGGDSRTKVIATTTMPYKAICKLFIKAKSGHNLIGTGWLSHTNKLYTAGHCVYNQRFGGWMESIVVVPGLTGTVEPYGRYTATDMLAPQWLDPSWHSAIRHGGNKAVE